MHRITSFNADTHTYEVEIPHGDNFILRVDAHEDRIGNVITRHTRNFVSGFMIDRLAEYENTGLEPDEIKELQGDILHKLKESNKILRQNNDEYCTTYQKLLYENRKLKSLLKDWLDKENY